jgi:large repetitive protein
MSSLFRRRAIVVPFVVLLLLAGTLPALAATVTRTSAGAITIAETGAASPYPSTIDVGGLYGGVIDVNVTIAGLSHEFPTDIAVLLVGPTGQSVVLMDDAGGESGRGASNVTLTFDDAATNFLSQDINGGLFSGTFKPTPAPAVTSNCNEIAAPASTPAGPYGTTLAVFNGTNPNGTWSLYVYDDCRFGAGSIASGWSLEINAAGPFVTVPSDITVPNDPGQAGAVVNYVVTGGDHVNDPITPVCSMPSGSFFPIGTTTVTCQVEDTNGRAATDSFTVTVTDSEGPALTLPANIVVPASGPGGATVTYVASATDNGVSVTVACNPPSGSSFPVGTTTVTCTATDSGNLSTSGSFTVTVIGATDLLAKLRADTIDLVTNSSAERALVATVDQAIQSSNSWGVYMALLKYVVQMDRYLDSRQVSPAAAQQLLLEARLVLNAIM